MECDLWEATAKGVSSTQLRRWTAQIVGSYSPICIFQLFDPGFLRLSVSMRFTTWASCTVISSQKISFSLAPGTCESRTWARHSYTTPPASLAGRATPAMQCLRRVTPLPSSWEVPSVKMGHGLHPGLAARATASKLTGGHSAASCT